MRDQARPFVRVGERMLVLEGPRVVAEAVFHEVFALDVDARLDALAAALRTAHAGDRADAGPPRAARTAAADVVDQARASLADDMALARRLMAELSRSVDDSWPHDSTLAVEVLACSEELARQAHEQRRTSTAERY